ncbi:MAG TPA: DUF4893 domain-containing protein [Allosphingosinicella sp.]|nr:DUF4893 domain-containing protein [Allosphingosinicella sp.]
MARKALIAALFLSLTSGCAMLSPPPRPVSRARVTVGAEEPWRNAATDPDARALDALPQLWTEALADARHGGYARRVAAEGALLAPAIALPRAAPAPGPYYCRIVRLGAAGRGIRPLADGGEGFCYVGDEPDQPSLTIEAGPRRIGGYLWGKDNRGLVFLGAQSPRGMPIGGYGDDSARDVAGLFERIGTFRYRLTLPSQAEPRLTIIEMRPATGR